MITRLTQLPGIGDTLATRITRHLGRGHEHLAVQAILSAPYSLTQVPRIGFRIADRVALFLGTHRDSPERHEQGNQFILGEDGTLPIHEFDRERQKLELTCFQHRRIGVVEDSGRVWLPQVLEDEMAFADWCTRLPLNQHPTLGPVQMTPELDALLGDLDELQQDDLALERMLGEGCPHCPDVRMPGNEAYDRVAAQVAQADRAGVYTLLQLIQIDPSDWDDHTTTPEEDLISMRGTLLFHWQAVAAALNPVPPRVVIEPKQPGEDLPFPIDEEADAFPLLGLN